jgi:hypothetical protein
MVDFIGRPYIDVRLSLNSFLPADTRPDFADRLVDYQLAMLRQNPDFHDKIEFEIAQTCYDFSFGTYAASLTEAGFALADVKSFGDSLRGLTSTALEHGVAGLHDLLSLTEKIPRRHTLEDGPCERIATLLTESTRYGTLPFSILARHAFIGVSLLKSLVARQVLSEDDVSEFMRSIHTVAADLVADIAAVHSGETCREQFLVQYGHLRPGTYEITSPRYDEAPDFYIGGEVVESVAKRVKTTKIELTASQERGIRECLSEVGLEEDTHSFFDYIATAISAREKAKFDFTRGISDVLIEVERWGAELSLEREDLAYLTIDTVLGGTSDHGALRAEIDRGRENQRVARAIRLPHLIVDPGDIYIVAPARGTPTFITSKSVTAKSVTLPTDDAGSIDNCIVLIESADPGFDWIFSHEIAGLVTQYGGANSHMAIRCAEFGLPAAIGCGERLFTRLLHASVIELNASARKVSGH